MSDKYNALKLINQARFRAKFKTLTAFFAKGKKFTLLASGIAFLALIVFFAINVSYKSAQEKYSTILHQSLIEEEKGDLKQAREKLQTIYEARFAPATIKAIASLRYAAILLNSGEIDKALTVYESIANNNSADSYLQDLSSLLASKIIVTLTDSSTDQKISATNLEKIHDFAKNSKDLQLYIIEQQGILELKLNKLEDAYKSFSSIINNREAAQSLRMRASDSLKIVNAKGYFTKEELVNPTTKTETQSEMAIENAN